MKLNPFITSAVCAAVLTSTLTVRAADDWKSEAISPVANPLFFESPLIQSEVRPIFVYHNIDESFLGGYARVYAVQVRYAINDRLAIIATKDGFIQLRPNVPGMHKDGWADIGAGLKYALIDDKENALIVTPGLKYELASGNTRVFQGNGKGELDFFVSAMKGFDKFHLTGSAGFRCPLDWDEETASIHYSLQLDYYTCQWFIPFVGINGFTVTSEGTQTAFGIEGFDLINFGDSKASGFTQIALATGFRSRLHKNVDFGFSYEYGLTHPRGLFDDRFTFDFIVRF